MGILDIEDKVYCVLTQSYGSLSYTLLVGYSNERNNVCIWISLREKCPDTEFFGPDFTVFGLNTERYSISLRI